MRSRTVVNGAAVAVMIGAIVGWAGEAVAEFPVDLWLPPPTSAPAFVEAVSREDEVAQEFKAQVMRLGAEVGGSLMPVALVPDEVVEADEELREWFAEGQRLYFFGSPQESREWFSHRVARETFGSAPWAPSPERARLIMNAGLFVVRAFLEEERPDAARYWVERLVPRFPAFSPDDGLFPPAVHNLWEEVRAEEAERGATFRILTFRDRECEMHLGGVKIPGSIQIVAQPGRSYLLSYSCNDGRRWARWVMGSEEREILSAPMTKRELEEELRALERQRGFPSMVVITDVCEEGDRCAGRWSQGDWEVTLRPLDEACAYRLVGRVPPVGLPEEGRGPLQNRQLLLLGAGAATTGGSLGLLLYTQRLERSFDCAENSSHTPSAEACQSVDATWLDEPSERQQYRNRLVLQRTGAILGMGIGLSLLTIGGISLRDQRSLRWHVGPGGASVQAVF